MYTWKANIQKHKSRLLESTEEKERRFHQAANDGNLYELELLLGSGDIDVNCRGDLADWTALHTAASNGHTASVDMLIENNATTDATDMFGYTPLFYAVRNFHKEVVQILLKHKASTSIENKWGETAMQDKASRPKVIMSLHSFSPLMNFESRMQDEDEDNYNDGIDNDGIDNDGIDNDGIDNDGIDHLSPAIPRQAGSSRSNGDYNRKE